MPVPRALNTGCVHEVYGMCSASKIMLSENMDRNELYDQNAGSTAMGPLQLIG